MRFILATILIFFITAGNAQACLGPSMEEYSFLRMLPQSAFAKDVIALVEIVEIKGEISRETQVIVIEPIKNTKMGQKFIVKEKMHSCARPYTLEKGSRFFIAGEINILGTFKGVWNSKEAGIW